MLDMAAVYLGAASPTDPAAVQPLAQCQQLRTEGALQFCGTTLVIVDLSAFPSQF